MGSPNESPCLSCGRSDFWLRSKLQTVYNYTLSWKDSLRIVLGILFATLALILLLSSTEGWLSLPKSLPVKTAGSIARSLAELQGN